MTAQILDHLSKHPLYQISNDTDYPDLGASLSLLDIAIDVGFPTSSYDPASQTKDEQDAFNQAIDSLTQKIQWISSKIVDAGIADLSRSEAREVASRLVYRLESAVRIGGARRKDHLAADIEDKDRSRTFFKKWLQHPGKGAQENVGVAQVDKRP